MQLLYGMKPIYFACLRLIMQNLKFTLNGDLNLQLTSKQSKTIFRHKIAITLETRCKHRTIQSNSLQIFPFSRLKFQKYFFSFFFAAIQLILRRIYSGKFSKKKNHQNYDRMNFYVISKVFRVSIV